MDSLECWHCLHWQIVRTRFGRRTSVPHGLFGGLLCFLFGSNHWACRLNIFILRIYLAISEVISRLGSLPIYDRHPGRTIFSTRHQKRSARGELAGNPAGKEGHCLDRLPARPLQLSPASEQYKPPWDVAFAYSIFLLLWTKQILRGLNTHLYVLVLR